MGEGAGVSSDVHGWYVGGWSHRVVGHVDEELSVLEDGLRPLVGVLDRDRKLLECGVRRRGSVRCSDGVLARPGGCANGAEPSSGRARARAAV